MTRTETIVNSAMIFLPTIAARIAEWHIAGDQTARLDVGDDLSKMLQRINVEFPSGEELTAAEINRLICPAIAALVNARLGFVPSNRVLH